MKDEIEHLSETGPRQFLRVLVQGFAGFDSRLLDGVVKLSQRRDPALQIVTATDASSADVVLVDGRDDQAVNWARAHQAFLAPLPVVWVDAHMAIPSGHTGVKRPLQWTNLPALLSRAMDESSYHRAGLDIDLPASSGQTPSTVSAEKVKAPTDAASQHMVAELSAAHAFVEKHRKNEQAIPIPVLVVDDSVAVRAHLTAALQSQGYWVTATDSGEAGLVAISNHDYACVLMDVLMPGIDGYDACRRIKSQGRSGKKAPPVIMLTSKSSPFDKIRGKMAGCDAYLTKPVEKSHLMEVLAQQTHKK